MLPAKRSNTWIVVCIIYTLFVLASFVINRILIQTLSLTNEMLRLLIFSAIVAALPCLAGYFGQQLFFYIYSIFTLAAIVYMMYIVYANAAPGWEDLTSIISFITIVLIGGIVAFVAQLIYYFAKKNKKIN
jgi:hypothetical protein